MLQIDSDLNRELLSGGMPNIDPQRIEVTAAQLSRMHERAEASGNVEGFFLELASVMETLKYRAGHDFLTGLPNRGVFDYELEKTWQIISRDSTRTFCLLFMDLNRFKEVNDTFGHPAGDSLLQAVSTNLNTALRLSDTICRLGGDEFAVIADLTVIQTRHNEPSQPISPLTIAMRVANSIENTRVVLPSGIEIGVGASIGAALGGNVHSSSDWYNEADSAMYIAKSNRGSFSSICIKNQDGSMSLYQSR